MISMFKNVSSPVEINRFTVDEIVNYIENNPDQLIIKQAREFVKRFGKDCIQYQRIKHSLPVVSWAVHSNIEIQKALKSFLI